MMIAIGAAPSGADAGPISRLYLTTSSQIAVVQGANLVVVQPQQVHDERAIAVQDTVRTAGYWPRLSGPGRGYSPSLGAPISSLSAPRVVNLADGATDGQYNLSVRCH